MLGGGAGALSVQTNTNNALFVDANGNVGIGTGVPMAKLDVSGNLITNSSTSLNFIGTKTFQFNPSGSTGRYFIGKIIYGSLIKLFIQDDGYGHGCGIEVSINIQWGNSTSFLPNITINAGIQQRYNFYFQGTTNSGIGYLWFNETSDSQNNSINYRIKVFSSGTIDLNTNDGLNGSTAALITRGLFNINGNVGIGTTNPYLPLHLHDASSVAMKYSNNNYSWNTGIGSAEYFVYRGIDSTGVYLAWGATGWSGNSDRRNKKNIKEINYGLNELLLLKPVRFDYKTDESESSKRIGFIAQDILEVIPECVDVSNPERYGIAPTELIPVLVKAIQEQQVQINALKAHLNLP